MTGFDVVLLYRLGGAVVDRVVLPTADAEAIERWFGDSGRRYEPLYITPPGEAAQVLHRGNYRRMERESV